MSIWSIAGLLVGIINYLIPFDKNTTIFGQYYANPETKSYEEVERFFYEVFSKNFLLY